MMKNKKIALLASILVATLVAGVFAATSTMWTYTKTINVTTPTEAAVQYTVLQHLPDDMRLDTEYEMIVECTNTAKIPYEVKAYLSCDGPDGFGSDDIFVRWKTYNNTGGAWVEFATGITEFYILGRLPSGYTGGLQGGPPFTDHGSGWIDWTGTYTTMNPDVTYTQCVWVTIYGSAPTGSYSVHIEVTGQGV